MTYFTCEHYSHSYALNLNKIPTKATDRFSRIIALCAFIAGMLLFLLGMFHFMPDILSGTMDIEQGIPKVKVKAVSLLPPDIFNLFIILTGIGVMCFSVVKFVGYKKVYFDGNTFTVKKRPFWGKKEVFSELLYNYVGVRLRVKFYQFGIFNKNKFIIELYHKDPEKIIPLYITTRKRKIRQIWKQYAQTLQMPGITVSEKGMVSHNFKDLDLPYAEVVNKWHLPQNFSRRLDKPSYITFKSNAAGDKMIKICKNFLDAFSVLNIFVVLVLGSLLSFAAANYDIMTLHMSTWQIWSFYAILFLIILYSFLSLLVQDVIFIAHNCIYIFRKILFLRFRCGVIPIPAVKGIDINYTPTTDRYFLSVVTARNGYIVGNKMSPEDLRWLRATMINEIIGN